MPNKIDQPTIIEVAMSSFGGYYPGKNDRGFYDQRFDRYIKRNYRHSVTYLPGNQQIKIELNFLNEERILLNKLLKEISTNQELLHSKILAYKIFIKSKKKRLQLKSKIGHLFSHEKDFVNIFNSEENRIYFIEKMINEGFIDTGGNSLIKKTEK